MGSVFRCFLRLCVVAVPLSCGTLGAQQANVAGPAGVVELFTSQGCSSCPPADRLVASMARDPKTVVLSFPVDYWDYIGWKDTLASPAFTARQKAYAAARGEEPVYTPQAVVNGLVGVVGSDRGEIEAAINTTHGRSGTMTLPLRIADADGTLHIEIGAGSGAPASVFVIRVARSRTIAIGRGENSGHDVTYTNVVRAIRRVTEWDGSAKSLQLTELKGDGEGYIVLVQQGTSDRPGRILGAAKSAGL